MSIGRTRHGVGAALAPAGARGRKMAGIALILLAFVLFACLDTTAKYLGAALAPLQIVWVRYLTNAGLALAVLRPWRAPWLYRTRHPVLHGLRAAALLGATLFNFIAIRHLQLAETASIFFLAPFLVTALAGLFLGERAGARRWAAILVGFAGALVIIQPGGGGFHPAMLLSVASVCCYAAYVLLTRRLAREDSTESQSLYAPLIIAVAMLPAGIIAWRAVPDLLHWGLLLATGMFGGLGHWFLVKAHERAPAAVLAPFVYSQLLWMTLLGYLVFGDVPGRSTILGALVIVASGLYLIHGETRATPRAPGDE